MNTWMRRPASRVGVCFLFMVRPIECENGDQSVGARRLDISAPFRAGKRAWQGMVGRFVFDEGRTATTSDQGSANEPRWKRAKSHLTTVTGDKPTAIARSSGTNP